MRKLHKPGENSIATLTRQSKHTKVKAEPKPTKTPDKPTRVVDMSMKKPELVEIAKTLNLSAKGTKAELITRINGESRSKNAPIQL